VTEDLANLFSVDGKVIVVTGGYGQIGAELTRGLAGAGAHVAILEPHPDPERTNYLFGAGARGVSVFEADVTNRDSLVHACASIAREIGVPTGLVNNAALDSPPDSGAEETGAFERYPESSWDRVMAVNVKGVFLACQVFGELMAQAGRGSIINVGSIYGAVSPDQRLYDYRRARGETFFKPVAYAASKSAIYNLTRYIAVYWGAQNVRANSVTFAGVFNDQDPQFLERYERKIPLRRGPAFDHLRGMADPADYVGPVAFLLSDAARYMTGADLRVDGGFLAL
jgi:NAD(P)-dependent dehydrogenase (short-subunit alcohol dehydrogenase family)